ncbi:hypothetical protein N0V88_000929 [Collariella sp. IMI 366227]|nr:hypothetical protein N0V88_000929 [Collariella sp. IMI 366227]
MATKLVVFLAAFFAAIYFTFFSGLVDAALLVFFTGVRQRSWLVDLFAPLYQTFKTAVGLSVRGRPEPGLREKLDAYLGSQGVDSSTYPDAYLVTAPRFLGYSFNPVSFWYLYDTDKCLAAMVLEVNNTFDERRMYFLVADDEPLSEVDPSSVGDEREHSKSSRSSAPQTTFKQSWPKDFHVSPFNSRKGSYTLNASDPLRPSTQSPGPISNTITLFPSQGHPKLIATLTSSGPTIDPSTLTALEKIHFLFSYSYLGLLTLPRTFLQASILYLRLKLRVFSRPEPLPTTLPRATPTEHHLEPIFRRYLAHLVSHSPLRSR